MSLPLGVKRWIFTDSNSNTAIVQINPNAMDTPTTPRSMQWGFAPTGGRMVGIDSGQSQPASWTFGGVILTKSHYDMLLLWAKKDEILQVEDHLGRTFEIIIEKYEPIERLPTPRRPWRADYTMSCLLLKEIT